ncbi:MAG: alpha/beta hydrolase family protein [Candidatus Hermodarchaeota archaeon]
MISKKESTVLEESEEYIIIGEMTHKDHHHLRKLLIFIMILIITLTCLQFNKTQSYNHYERVQFESSGSLLYANLYYPSKTLDFQERRPLIIYCHGIGSKRDFDLRIPIEFTKRGFYVAALDYQGHGESGGNINNIDPITGIPALAQDCTNLLDKLETMSFYFDVNLSQIGLIGHSLGGMIVLMNQALDSRFKVTVALAPLVNFNPPRFGFVYNENLIYYIPVNLLNEENTENLLIIHHENDEILDFTENALRAQELTNCTVIKISGFLLGGAHQLFSDSVLIKSIEWFEWHFFNSTTINGPIDITFYFNYILIFINILIIFITIISLISVSASLFFRNNNKIDKLYSLNYRKFDNSNKRRQVIKPIAYTGAFLLNWILFERIFGMVGIIYGSIGMILFFAVIKLALYFKESKNIRFNFILKEKIKLEFKLKYSIFTAICAAYFIGIYMLFSFYYPFGFIWPSNFVVEFILGYLAFPVFLSVEILLRKLIYPNLKFLKSESSKNRILIITSIIVTVSLMGLMRKFSYFPSVLFMYIIFLLVIIQNTKIFQNVNSFYPVVIISFSIIQIFFATVLSNAIGISMVL